MKQLPTLPLAAALLLSAATASAQTTFRFGLRGGLNRALTTVDPASNTSGVYPFSYSTDKSALYAWQAGVVGELRSGKIAFQPALLFSQKGNQFHTSSYVAGFAGYSTLEATGTTRTNWLELPLNLVYTLHTDHGLQVFAGPYVAFAVGGHQQGTATSYTSFGIAGGYRTTAFDNQRSYGPGTGNQRFDAGLNLGVGYRQGPLQVQLGYGLGLLNVYKTSSELLPFSNRDYGRQLSSEVTHNRVAQLTGTYFFGL
jgi:hypothetical protein